MSNTKKLRTKNNQKLEFPLVSKSSTRRRTLLGIAGGALGATQSPAAWVKPMVNSVLIPTHAETSSATDAGAPTQTTSPPPDSNPCVGESRTINTREQFAIDVTYDGSSTGFSIRARESIGDVPADTIVSCTKSPSFAIGAGRAWEQTTPNGGERNVADGTYTRSTTRLQNGQPTGDSYDVTFCISTSGEGDARSMTLTLVSVIMR